MGKIETNSFIRIIIIIMESIGNQINIINDVLKTQDATLITNTINSINPIIIMYYKMTDASINSYIDKKPLEEYFNFDDNDVDILIKINDINFVIYLINELTFIINHFNSIHPKEEFFNSKALDSYNGIPIDTKEQYQRKINYLITNMIMNYIETNDMDNIKIMIDNKFFFADDFIESCISNNNPKALNMFLMEPSNHIEDFENIEDNNSDSYIPDDADHFKGFYCSYIFEHGDLVEIIKVFYEFSKKFPQFSGFDFNLVFNGALMYGRNKCMHYVLNNSVVDYYHENSNPGTTITDIFEFNDSISYAIMGKNMNNIETVFDMFMNHIDNDNWEYYFKFAAVYGTLDIIKYMITLKPHLVDIIDNFYNNILKFALCQGDLDIVKFAMDNGAKYSTDMIEFAKEYNNGREDNVEIFTDDYLSYDEFLFGLPENIDEKIEECMRFIHNN